MKSGIFTENSQNLAVNSEKSQINFTDIIVTNQKNFVSVYSSNLNFQGIYIQDLSDTAFKVDTSIASLENILMNNTAKPFYIYNSNIKGNLMTINHATLTTVIKHSEVLISNLYFDNSNQGFEISNSNIDLSYIDVRNCISPLRIDSSNASIVNAYFKSNHDTALISYNSSMALIDSVLEENHGIDGGGIYITQPRSSRIRSTLFKNNTAYLGGGIYHDYSPVSIYNCEFFDNQAEYGNDVASYPRNILSLIPNYTNIQSGSIIENLTFLLQDIYNQPVSTQSLLSASIQSKTNNSVIGGANEVYAVDGKFVFKDLKIFNKPGESSSFLISTDNQDILPLEFSVSFRDCNIGEILSSDLSCNECENNTYSLSLDDQFCKACPAEASCLGGKDIFPVEGYWRSDVFSETFYVCPNHYACLGLKSDHTGGCGTGYQGTLCSICTEGYFRSNSYVCLECPQK